jgi:hypothetical protein
LHFCFQFFFLLLCVNNILLQDADVLCLKFLPSLVCSIGTYIVWETILPRNGPFASCSASVLSGPNGI